MARLPADLAALRGHSTAIAADWLASTFDVVVEVARLRDGRVRVLRVSELEIGDHGRIEVTDVFRFSVSRLAAGGAVEGTFSPSGVIPKSLAQLQLQGLRVETSVFSRPPSK
jgi:pilus assembly protein CpaF